MSAIDRLRDAAKRLADVDERRAEVLRERDAEIAAAFEEGATWVQVQEASGLALRSLQKALERHRSAER
ncbi:hypothetical protein [Agromyces sp. NPDC058104]|uniref:hypothetical protein n=1 Tax=Agromyces sp. NPDC058104 TaxID=3346342 RepID=UPI0036DCB2ED